MTAVLPFIVLTLIGLADCIEKRQCSCFNARQFAVAVCQGITDFENLFAVSGNTIAPFGSVLDAIAGRSDSRTVINEICSSQSCFSRLDTLYSCCVVSRYVCRALHAPYSGKVKRKRGRKEVWRIDSFRVFGESKFVELISELIDQPIG